MSFSLLELHQDEDEDYVRLKLEAAVMSILLLTIKE
jgi:hypothetical protein